jgi:hypothetical protein
MRSVPGLMPVSLDKTPMVNRACSSEGGVMCLILVV